MKKRYILVVIAVIILLFIISCSSIRPNKEGKIVRLRFGNDEEFFVHHHGTFKSIVAGGTNDAIKTIWNIEMK